MKKVILVLLDGMRPDAMMMCKNPTADFLMKNASYTLSASTVMPSVTLPCHMSLIHSVDPIRHGITTNTFTPQVRPVTGLFEQLSKYNKKCMFFYDWGELKDLYQPDSLSYSQFVSGHTHSYKISSERSTNMLISEMKDEKPDFSFLYFGETDQAGHDFGWMSKEYISSINHCFSLVQKIIDNMTDDYVLLITADHGGHDRTHGTDLHEDMTIPFIAYGEPFERGAELKSLNIKDIAPTITELLSVSPDGDWDGKSIL